MHRLYSISLPTQSADPPTRWSFSGIEQWRICPRRWWLLHSKYNGHSYPTPVTPTALRGQVIHEALEAYSLHLQRATTQATFDVRKFIRRRLDESLADHAENNPRVHTPILRARFSVDEAVSFFWQIAEHFKPARAAAFGAAAHSNDGPQNPLNGPEVWIQVDDPLLCGRIDFIEDHHLVEFKTAEEDEKHEEQLRFYALLWWLRTGSLPQRLSLAYVHTDKWVDIPVPTLAEFHDLRDEYRSLLTQANRMIQQGTPDAHVSVETCRYCPVRQLCGEYWQTSSTLSLRNVKSDAEISFLDVRLSAFPNSWIGFGSLSGIASADALGEVSVFIGAHKCPSSDLARPAAAVLLGARVQRDGNRWKVTAPPTCEVFWTMSE